ncbi:MAG: hypothetical protein P8K79_06855 [Mariniblastus sp.]|nr:hypothetical protein [Mariniblastus sp.]
MNNLFQKGYLFTVFLGLSAYVCGQVSGQTYSPPSYPSQPAPQSVMPPTTLPPTVLPPINANSGVAAPSQVVAPPFDPFQPRTQTFPMTLGNQSSPITVLPPQQQFITPTPNQFSPSNYGGFPKRWPETAWAWPAQNWADFRSETKPTRFFDRTRFRSTTLPGNGHNGANYLSINTVELATTMTFQPNPNWSPLRVSPGFAFNWWGGPKEANYNLPPRVYDAVLSTDFCSNQCNRVGFETDFTIGFYSDFRHSSSSTTTFTAHGRRALRYQGVLLGWFRLNQTNTFKFGVEYLDRQRIKLLPCFGVFITPTPDFRFDLYFPRPRLAQRVRSFTSGEMWAYVGSEYGGGSWAVERRFENPNPALNVTIKDQVDVNDIRSFIGIEYTGPKGRTGFFEIGYVSNRDIILRSGFPQDKLDLRDTIMLRSGLAF